jgi:type IV pilus assembly protein PilA
MVPDYHEILSDFSVFDLPDRRATMIEMRRVARARGFTLVELATVVVIVGVLAVIATVGFSRYRAEARLTEAKDLTADIRAAQEAYKAESGLYARVSSDVDSRYPAINPGTKLTAWGGPCTTCVTPDAWSQLHVHPGGPVIYGYATVAGVGANLSSITKPSGAGSEIPLPVAGGPGPLGAGLAATDPFYVTVAWGDTNGDGTPSIVVSYSISTQLFVQAE